MATSSAAIPECLPSIMLICGFRFAAATLRKGSGILGPQMLARVGCLSLSEL